KKDTTALIGPLATDTMKFKGTDTGRAAATAANKPVDSATIKKNANPILSILQPVKPQQDQQTGKVQYPAIIGYIRAQDTATVGTRTWAQMTKDNVGKPIAIVLDKEVYSAPFVNGEIPYGSSQITGSFTTNEAQDLASILQSGKLPAPAKIVQEQIVGPTLGKEAVNGGAMSFFISFVVIFVLMLIYYNTAGWVANIAL